MPGSAVTAAAALLIMLGQAEQPGVISGTVLNGTRQRQPMANAEVVLRAGRDGSFASIAATTTDSSGRFTFENLAADEGVIYLPGANRDEVHYPGPRVRLSAAQPRSNVTLVAYDAVESPSPLVARRHEIEVRAGTGFLDVAETLIVDNPSRAAYVGDSSGEGPPVTIRLAIPAGFETVTFDKEFYGRNFLVHGDKLVSDLPWPPGTRELKYRYRLPVERRNGALVRTLDLPTDRVLIRVVANDSRRVACNLTAAADSPQGEIVFVHEGDAMPAGQRIELELGDLRMRWESQSKWLALALLAALVAISIAWSHRRHRIAQAAALNLSGRRVDRREPRRNSRRARRRSSSASRLRP